MCSHRVASVAKYKGDKAKKEFSIDNSVELNRIRNKYAEQLTTEDDKKILPEFFAHIARQKGYYDPQHKAYIQHDTSMDYLQSIVRRFKTKNRIPKPTSRLLDLFDTKTYDERRVNHKQISHIMKYVQWYSVEVSKLFDNSYYAEEETINERDLSRFERYQILQNELVDYINKYRMGYSTMVFIIKQFENKEFYKYRNILLPLLYTLCNDSFIDALVESSREIEYLVEGGNEIKLFDFSYDIKKNQPKLTKNDQKCQKFF